MSADLHARLAQHRRVLLPLPSVAKLPGMLFIAPVSTGTFAAAILSAIIHASAPPAMTTLMP